MGLPSITLNADLAKTWCAILKENDLKVCRDEYDEKLCTEDNVSRRVLEVLWQIGDGTAQLNVLEATYRNGGDVHLIFMPVKTKEQHLLDYVLRSFLLHRVLSREQRKRKG